VSDAASGVRRLAYAGALTALAVGICYLEQIPWFELQSLVVFAAGFLLGARTGAVVGGLAMGIYSLANPYGMAHPLVLASQVAGRALVGASGGWAARLGLPRAGLGRALALVGWALAGSVFYDALTNAASGLVYGQVAASLWLGAPWAAAHALTNAVAYAVVGGPLTTALEARRGALVAGVVALALLATTAGPAGAQDSTATAPFDTTLRIVPDTSRTPAAPPPAPAPLPVRGTAFARWALSVGADERLRRAPGGPDDAWRAAGAGPRFYEDRADAEPLVFAGMPWNLATGAGDRAAAGPRSTVWQEPGAWGSGALAAAGWSAPEAAAEDTLGDVLPGPAGLASWGGRGEWGSATELRHGRNAFSSVWLGVGGEGHSEQGFLLDLGRPIRGVDAGAVWSAWTRSADPLGALGLTAEHGLSVRLSAATPGLRLSATHDAHRAAIEDALGFERERRGSERTTARLEARAGEQGAFGGLAAERDEEHLDSEGPVIEPLVLRGRDTQASAWLGVARGGWRLGARGGWWRERVRRSLGAAAYTPDDIEGWRGGGFLEGRAGGGSLALGVDGERAAGRTTVAPRLAWTRAVGGRATLDVRASRTSAPTLAETGATDPSAGPERFVTRGWTAQAGVRVGDPAHASSAEDTSAVRSVPGRVPGTPFSGSLSLVGWSLRDVSFLGFGLLARDILEGETVLADADGGAVVATVEWWPRRWVTIGGNGYAAARQSPAGVALAAPDYRWTAWAGPRARLFQGSLDLMLLGELDVVGPRAAADENLPAIARPCARLVLGFGDAWVVVRGIDLDDVKHPLPGRDVTGERLRSPGREIRATLEWRFRN